MNARSEASSAGVGETRIMADKQNAMRRTIRMARAETQELRPTNPDNLG
jgi:hypothetical protein